MPSRTTQSRRASRPSSTGARAAMMLVLFLLAAAAAATPGESRPVLGGVEPAGDRIWTTSTGVTVICGGQRHASVRPPSTVERHLSAVLDGVCRLLERRTGRAAASAVGDSYVSDQDALQDGTADVYQSVRYDIKRNYNNINNNNDKKQNKKNNNNSNAFRCQCNVLAQFWSTVA